VVEEMGEDVACRVIAKDTIQFFLIWVTHFHPVQVVELPHDGKIGVPCRLTNAIPLCYVWDKDSRENYQWRRWQSRWATEIFGYAAHR
jgi:hypothetical protein